ncbi:hypothetical protein CDL12_01552 [Handroanthus impetiginosus]|uniref:Uncharacterized protein n=1 Tax=Handroanthus impetiginosus TaxID=429701 RepID=A0A2G9I7G4_9LAMI|nr:hypothetical protein CDL12_01552 [Handroanthus impetiginosus]
MEEDPRPPEPGNLKDKVDHLKEAFDRHDRVLETFRQSHIQSIEDLNDQVHELSLKMEQSIQIKDNIGSSSSIVAVAAASLPRIEFPKFHGKDFEGWRYKCNLFFQLFEKIPDESKVKLASIHMEGDALCWHKEFMGSRNSTLPLNWDEYVRKVEEKFNKPMCKSGPKQSESTPSIEMKKPRQRICKLRGIGGNDEGKKPYFSFGPIYYKKDDVSAKKEAWQHVLKNTPGGAAVTTEIYLSAVREIEKSARDSYAREEADRFTDSQFRWMMIFDGCFFLQLALYVLDGSQQLGYRADHNIFGKSRSDPRYKDVKKWIEAMFFVGNQLPLVVLKRLMKQSYFQKVINEWKPRQPSDLSRRALYGLLLLPEKRSYSPRMWGAVKSLWEKVFDSRIHWMLQQKPNDLLHGFHLLVLGPQLDSIGEEEGGEEEEDQDLESQQLGNSLGATGEMTSFSATNLRQAGIHFLLSRGIGSRSIHFTNSIFFCHGYAILHLPPILISDDAGLMFQCLRDYEISQKLDRSKREVCSYLQFMSELIQTPDDAKILASKGIIQGNPKFKHKLPGILRGLPSRDTYNQNLRVVKLKINDYTPPIWKKYWHIISFGFALTILQTVYTVLPYYKKS